MTICLNKQIIDQYNMTIDEVLLMIVLENNVDLDVAQKNLINKGYITVNRNELFLPIGWRLTNTGKDMLNAIIVDSDKHQEPQEKLTDLATKLKTIFPKGKKDGTNYYWSDGVPLVIRRLKLFFKKYGSNFTNEQIIQATKKYVEGFNGSYQYMRLLKYFIFKEKVGANGEIEGDSELISYIENADEEENLKNEWTSTLN
mgnify:CR=1 FL=1